VHSAPDDARGAGSARAAGDARAPGDVTAPGPSEDARAPGGTRGEARRVRLVRGGPVLVEGPVTVVGDDGVPVTSDRFMVALCTCRRSRRYPWCDTSHRRRTGTRDTPHDEEKEGPR
jgi:CDGSH-type Zn-finger protein